MKITLTLLSFALFATLFSSCGKHQYTKEDLNPALAKHFIDIRWGRVVRASENVPPEMRTAFVKHWNEQTQVADVQDIDVVASIFNDAGDSADVSLNITWVHRSEQRVRTDLVTQVWSKTEKGWIAKTFVTLPISGSGFGGAP